MENAGRTKRPTLIDCVSPTDIGCQSVTVWSGDDRGAPWSVSAPPQHDRRCRRRRNSDPAAPATELDRRRGRAPEFQIRNAVRADRARAMTPRRGRPPQATAMPRRPAAPPVGASPRHPPPPEPDANARENTTMKLTDRQIADFHAEGYLFLPGCFRRRRWPCCAPRPRHLRRRRPEVWREKSGAPRTAFAAHTYNEAFRLLGPHPRLIQPVEQFFGEPVYMHQFKINAKAAVRRRGLAVAPGLRHLGARRRHARAARHEHRGVPRRGHADQRPADVHPAGATSAARWPPATTRPRPPIRCGRSTRRR